MKNKKILWGCFAGGVVLLAGLVWGAIALFSKGDATIEGKLKTYVSDDAAVVVTADFARALDAADVEKKDGKLVLPDYLADMVDNMLSKSDKNNFEEFLELKGIDWSTAVFAIDGNIKKDKPEMLLIYSVTDAGDLAKSLEDVGDFESDEEDGYTVITQKKDFCTVIKGGLGFIAITHKGFCKSSSTIDMIDNWKKRASDKPLADWKLKELSAPKIVNVFFDAAPFFDLLKNQIESYSRYGDNSEGAALKLLEQYKDCKVLYSMDLDGATASLSAKIFDKNGKDVKNDIVKPLDNEVYKYATSKDIIFGATGLGDVSKYLDQLEKTFGHNGDLAMARQYAKTLSNSTIFAAAGPADGLNSFTNPSLTNWHIVVGIKCADTGKANELFGTLRELSTMTTDSVAAMPTAGNTFTLRIPCGGHYDYDMWEYITEYMNVYAKLDGSTIVFTNMPNVGGACRLNLTELNGKTCGILAAIEKGDKLLNSVVEVPFGIKALLTAEQSQSTFSLSLTGTKDKFLKAIFSIAGSALQGGKSYEAPLEYDNDTIPMDDLDFTAEELAAEAEEVAPAAEYAY